MFVYFTHLHKNSCKVLIVQPIFDFFILKIKLENFYTDNEIYNVILNCVKVMLFLNPKNRSKSCEHGGFLQSQSHMVIMPAKLVMHVLAHSNPPTHVVFVNTLN